MSCSNTYQHEIEALEAVKPSPEPFTGSRPERSPCMIVRVVSATAARSAPSLPAHPITAANSEQGHDEQAPQHGLPRRAREYAAVIDVAADNQSVAAGKAEDIGEGEPLLPRPPARGGYRRIRPASWQLLMTALSTCHASPVVVGDEIEAVAGSSAPLGDDAHELLKSARTILLGEFRVSSASIVWLSCRDSITVVFQ